MAKFGFDLSAGNNTVFDGNDEALSVDELLEVLRPAAVRLRDAYVDTLDRLFARRSGQLAESIMLDDDYLSGKGSGSKNYAWIKVAPYGRRKGSKRSARSRKGSPTAKYAKHNRTAKATQLSNAELGYLLEVGTPRIPATHWMENTNDAVGGEVQGIIDDEFQKLLDKKGL